ncbi:MAG: CDP-diacylglycerol--glycerol-3-phosphate 3-phosphatidyltransferase [Clostridia bacterium]|nr:CDP-diacylglycerol--glycerol-3-phosphate 3-phosphatidyltransferase [Oscillospiraceae bacterium]MBR4892535.1 CDP-diacylglycerol--glycerol-3-phosphate 3-phosphatidyltransferase [Clostridia bacterium]
MNLPNKLTVLRIILVPVLLVLIYNINDSFLMSAISLATFLLISLTDMLDGHIARKRNLITDFGKFLDPLADKILVISTMITFIDMGYISSIAVIIIIMREFLVTSLRLVASSTSKVIAASKLGKLKTIIQIVVLAVMFFTPMISQVYIGKIILFILEWAMVLITIVSGADYLIKNKDVIKMD